MKIVFIGQKGIPATFGGIEYHVDRLSRGLVREGHEVIVYVRGWYTPRALRIYGGVRLIHVPTIRTKHLDAAVHSLLATGHSLFTGAGIIHYHGPGPSFFCWIPRLLGRRVVATVHRLDWAADKWGPFARAMLKLAERTAARFAQMTIVVSRDIRDHFLRAHGRDTVVIPNGGETARLRPLFRMTSRHGLEPGRYVLFLGRLVPEKRPDWVIRAFLERTEGTGGLKLVLAGGSSGTDDYVKSLESMARGDPRIVFTGYVRGEDKEELFTNALLFVLPSRLEGYPIALLEARAYGLGCLASDLPPHQDVIRDGSDGVLFRTDDFGDFALKMDACLRDPERIRSLGARARERAAAHPDWESVVRDTIRVYGLASSPLPQEKDCPRRPRFR